MINTSLSGRLRNTHLPKSHGLAPLFEAVVNSIQSIDATFGNDVGQGRITIEIFREDDLALDILPPGRAPLEPITEFCIRDNGAGFHSANMASFETLDSEYKLSDGCRGVGRLLWLKAFKLIDVQSAFREGGEFWRRRFRFNAQDGILNHEKGLADRAETFAEVRLSGFEKVYQKSSRKMTSTIARDLMEHCLWYFVREGGAPTIRILDGGESVDLQMTFEDYMRSSSTRSHFTVRNARFDLIHLKLKASSKSTPHLNWCAANRVVVEETLSGKVPGLYGPLFDEQGEFIYAGYLTSSFLDEHVRPERTDFDLEETDYEGDQSWALVLSDEEPSSRSEIRDAALRQIEAYLGETLEAAKQEGRGRIERFVRQKAPRYRPILRRIDEEGATIDPGLSDRDLELELHKHLANLEAEVLREGQEVLGDTAALDLGPEEYSKKIAAYLAKIEDVKKSDLVAYVSRRRVVLDILQQAIRIQPDGKYRREDYIHNLIMPMRTTSTDDAHRSNNMWIVDERLAFHNYLASDKTIKSMPITTSSSTKEPDVLALQTYESPILMAEGSSPYWASLSILEIKRPMRDDATGKDNDPIEQCLDYLQRVREGGVRTEDGRPIPNAEQVPGFCYILADITKTLKSKCRLHQLNPTADGTGFFGYHANFNAYIEVISFDGLVDVANRRNRAFFDVIGLPLS